AWPSSPSPRSTSTTAPRRRWRGATPSWRSGPSTSASSGSRAVDSVGTVLVPHVGAHHPCYQHGQEQLPADALDDGQASSDVATRNDVAIAQRRQGDEAEVDGARAGEVAGGGDEGGRRQLLQNPVKETHEDACEQIPPERLVQSSLATAP